MLRRAFTLIELLVVIAIIAIQASMLMPALARTRRQTRHVACESNLRQMGQILYMYGTDNDGRMPTASEEGDAGEVYQELYNEGYLETTEILRCPSDDIEEVDLNEEDGVSYLIDPTMPQHRHPTRAIMGDNPNRENHVGGVNVLFENGHVRFTEPTADPYGLGDYDFFGGVTNHPENAHIRWGEDAAGWYALEFENNASVLLPDTQNRYNDHLQGEARGSIAAWVKAAEGNTRQWIITGRGAHSGRYSTVQFGMYGDGKIYLVIHNGNSSVIWADGVGDDIPLNEWVHLAFTLDGSEAKIYMDGTEEHSRSVSPIAIVPWSYDLHIGGSPHYSSKGWEGHIGDVQIYDRGLSSGEIQDLYAGGRVTDGLVGHWAMNEGEGGTTRDSIGDIEGLVGHESQRGGSDHPAPGWVGFEAPPWQD